MTRWVLAASLAFPSLAAAMPQRPQGYVSDLAGVLDAGVEAELSSLIAQVERETSAELAVVTVPSLEGLTVEDYAERLYKAWGIGKKGKDNGVLILVAPAERKTRIEVGYGLEGRLPDGRAGEIIRRDMLPSFKGGDFGGGLRAGTRAVADALGGRTMPPPPREDAQPGAAVVVAVFYLLFLFSGGIFLGVKEFKGAAIFDGMGTGVLVWGLLSGAGGRPADWLPMAAFAGIAATLLGAVIAWAGRQGGLAGPGGGWTGGGDWGGGGFSGGSDFGGFGGGSSGGGGASGSW